MSEEEIYRLRLFQKLQEDPGKIENSCMDCKFMFKKKCRDKSEEGMLLDFFNVNKSGFRTMKRICLLYKKKENKK